MIMESDDKRVNMNRNSLYCLIFLFDRGERGGEKIESERRYTFYCFLTMSDFYVQEIYATTRNG